MSKYSRLIRSAEKESLTRFIAVCDELVLGDDIPTCLSEALKSALGGRNSEIIRHILENHDIFSLLNPRSIIHKAIENERDDVAVQIALALREQIQIVRRDYELALRCGCPRFVSYCLVSCGITPRDDDLLTAVNSKSSDTCRILARHREVDILSIKQGFAIRFAASLNNTRTVIVLLLECRKRIPKRLFGSLQEIAIKQNNEQLRTFLYEVLCSPNHPLLERYCESA